MCYYVSVKTNPKQLMSAFNAPFPPGLAFKGIHMANGFSHPLLPVLTFNDGKSLNLYQWGLIPNLVKTKEQADKIANLTLNAKSESVFEKPAFKENIVERRCIVPVTGFFEYKHVGKEKTPYFIYPKVQAFFNLAGIFNHWTDPNSGKLTSSFSILTGPANELMASIHNSAKRMPLMIDDANIDMWIGGNIAKGSIIELMQSCDDTNMAAYQVNKNLIGIGDQPKALEEVINQQLNLFS